MTWQAGDVPVSTRFDDPYFSLEDGLAETRHVFIDGNRLAERLRPGFLVAELGVGTGLNLLALAACAEEIGARDVRYCGFEAFPLDPADLRRALRRFDGLGGLVDSLVAAWRPDGFEARIGPVDAQVICGDARRTVPAWSGRADAWFLDGFAPARNPELWEPSLLAAVGARTASGGSVATYSAAGAVRRALAAAGFEVERCEGYGRKRHMTIGRKPS